MADLGKSAYDSVQKALLQIGNLFDPNTITRGYLVNPDGSLLASASYATSDFIPVLGSTLYLFSSIRVLTCFDVNKNTIPTSTTSPASLSYIGARLGVPIFYKTNPSAKFVRVSSLLTSMTDPTYTVIKVANPSKWVAKIWSSYGDSLTQMNMWQPYVQEVTGFMHYNYGIGGTKVADTTGLDTNAMCRDERINQVNSGSNFITYMGFTNDWAQGVPLGTLGSTDTTTAYGALNILYQKLITRCPTARIVALTPPFQKYPNRAGWTDTTGLKNNLNLTVADYGQVTKDVSKMYGIPVIDLYSNVGWNDINATTYLTTESDGALLHPNDTGGQRLASMVIGILKQLEPII